MTEDVMIYNDVPTNTRLTRNKIRTLICELYKMEGRWELISQQDKQELWYALKNPVFERILTDLEE